MRGVLGPLLLVGHLLLVLHSDGLLGRGLMGGLLCSQLRSCLLCGGLLVLSAQGHLLLVLGSRYGLLLLVLRQGLLLLLRRHSRWLLLRCSHLLMVQRGSSALLLLVLRGRLLLYRGRLLLLKLLRRQRLDLHGDCRGQLADLNRHRLLHVCDGRLLRLQLGDGWGLQHVHLRLGLCLDLERGQRLRRHLRLDLKRHLALRLQLAWHGGSHLPRHRGCWRLRRLQHRSRRHQPRLSSCLRGAGRRCGCHSCATCRVSCKRLLGHRGAGR